MPVNLGEPQNEYGEDNRSKNPVIACGKTDREIDYQPRKKKPDQENQNVEENRVSRPKSVEPIHAETSREWQSLSRATFIPGKGLLYCT